jgi:O-antigen/teichoic acid export membrane protein
VIPLIWGHDFDASVKMLQYILPGILFMSIYRIISSRLSGIGLPQISIYVFLPALILNVILNLVWIPGYGAMGAVWATNISYTAATIAYIFVYSKIIKMPVYEMFRFRRDDFNFISDLIKKYVKQ